MSAQRSARIGSPAAVEAFAERLAEWLASFTVPQELGAAMAEACSAGAPWAAALAGTSVRRAGWPEREALAWGIAVGACAGALEAGRRSLAGTAASAGRRASEAVPAPGRVAEGPALPLLAADGLIAAAHEAIASLEPERLLAAMEALALGFGDGGPWRRLGADAPRPAWPAVVACGLRPAAREDPEGPWADLADAWSAGDEARLADHSAADADTRELFAAAARAAREADTGDDGERF
ncbi:MAG TPA: hypothetical protein VIE68_03690 [Gemmatimonadota bacterium]